MMDGWLDGWMDGWMGGSIHYISTNGLPWLMLFVDGGWGWLGIPAYHCNSLSGIEQQPFVSHHDTRGSIVTRAEFLSAIG